MREWPFGILSYSKHKDVLQTRAHWVLSRRIVRTVILEYVISMQLQLMSQTIEKHC